MVNFDTAPTIFAKLAGTHLGRDVCSNSRIVRDVFGRLMFVTRNNLTKDQKLSFTNAVRSDVAGFVDEQDDVIVSIDKAVYLKLSDEPYYRVSLSDNDSHVMGMIDRRLAGDDWLIRPQELKEDPKILIFYSIKGGVGRSTALAVTAAEMANSGKNVLVVDFDLEAPALGTLLLDERSTPEYGIVDWFAALSSGANIEALLPDMVGSSPFTSPAVVVDVVPCFGSSGGDYISKLSRVYTPGSAGITLQDASFAQKAAYLIDALKVRRHYDVILVDARAGLHETSGALLLGLGACSLLFGVDTNQTFDGYDLLLSAFATVFEPAQENLDLRGAMKMVHAKAPQDPDQKQAFIASSWAVWSENLYDDESQQDGEIEIGTDKFVFDVADESAPHYPLEIVGSEAFLRFDPRKRAYTLEKVNYEPVFGAFLAGVKSLLDFVE